MGKKSGKIRDRIYPYIFILLIIAVWTAVSYYEIVPKFMLPSVVMVIRAFISDFSLLVNHAMYSLYEAFLGLFISIAFAFIAASLMDLVEFLKKSLYPILILTQTIPVIAIAPLLVLWFGYGMTPKIVLIFLVCFFPMAIGLLQGIASVDSDLVRLFKSMGASRRQILFSVKLPAAMPEFFGGLKIAASYSIVGAVVAEWLGGDYGLGVYMTRVRKSFSFDKMFAVIILVSIISLILIWLVERLERKVTSWQRIK